MRRFSNGFTVFEIVIVLAILVVILGVIASIFIYMYSQQSKLIKIQQLNAEANYVMTYVATRLQDSQADSGGNCIPSSSGGNGTWEATHLTALSSPSGSYYEGIKYLDSNNVCHEIYLDTDGILKEDGNAITNQEFPINYFIVALDGDKTISTVGGSDSAYPRATLSLSISNTGNEPDRLIQTTVSWWSSNGL